MSAEADGNLWAGYVEYRGVRFPIDIPAGVQRQPQQPYPPATQLGPADRPPLDQRLAAMTFADASNGLGVLDLQEQEGITNSWWSTLETRFRGRIGLPPNPRVLVTPDPAAMNGANGPPGGRFQANQPIHAMIYRTSVAKWLVTYGMGQHTVIGYNLLVSPPAVVITGHDLTHLLPWRDRLVGVGSGGTKLIDGNMVVYNRDATPRRGLTIHDNKLWSFNQTTRRLSWTVDPDAGVWTDVGDALWLADGEGVAWLTDWRDKTGQPALMLASTRRIVGFDEEPGEWREQWPILWEIAETPYPMLTVWRRDEQLYLIMPSDPALAPSRYVMQFTGSTSQVGPGKTADFPYWQYGSCLHVQGNVHYLYIWCGGFGNNDGAVLATNEQGGWHCLYQPTQAVPPPVPPGAWDLPSAMLPAPANTHGAFVGGTVYNGTVYTIHQDGTLVGIEDRDDLVSPPDRVGAGVDSRPRAIWYPDTDCGLPNHYKSGAYLYIDMRLPDNSPGLVSGSQLEVFYTIDGEPWVRLPFGEPLTSHPVGLLTTLTTTGGAKRWPLLIPLPDGDWQRQFGVPFRRFQPALMLRGPSGVPSSTIAELTLYYSRWVAQRYAYQCVVDLTRLRFPEQESLFEGRSAGELRNLLFRFANEKTRAPLAFGTNEWRVDIPAADLFLGAQEDIADMRGRYQVTFRDLSTYEDA